MNTSALVVGVYEEEFAGDTSTSPREISYILDAENLDDALLNTAITEDTTLNDAAWKLLLAGIRFDRISKNSNFFGEASPDILNLRHYYYDDPTIENLEELAKFFNVARVYLAKDNELSVYRMASFYEESEDPEEMELMLNDEFDIETLDDKFLEYMGELDEDFVGWEL